MLLLSFNRCTIGSQLALHSRSSLVLGATLSFICISRLSFAVSDLSPIFDILSFILLLDYKEYDMISIYNYMSIYLSILLNRPEAMIRCIGTIVNTVGRTLSFTVKFLPQTELIATAIDFSLEDMYIDILWKVLGDHPPLMFLYTYNTTIEYQVKVRQ